MQKVQLGNSNVSVTPIIFGAWAIGGWMWGGADRKDAINAIHKSLDLGITSIDTAPVYGFGVSEELTGKAVKGIRKEVQILTKYGLRWDKKIGKYYFPTTNNEGKKTSIYKYSGKESVISECEQSLRRLGTDYIDLYQIHWPDPTTPVDETMEAVGLLIKEGKVLAAGVCNYSLDEMKEAENKLEMASNQVPYSMLRRDIESDLVPWCIENNKSILAYSPLQRGLLTGKISKNHVFNDGDSRPLTPWYKENNIEKINQFLISIKPFAENRNATLAQLVLRWTLQKPGITAVLAGARNADQVTDNARAMSFSLSDEEMNIINDYIDKLNLDLT